jgi:hypothetical protein
MLNVFMVSVVAQSVAIKALIVNDVMLNVVLLCVVAQRYSSKFLRVIDTFVEKQSF